MADEVDVTQERIEREIEIMRRAIAAMREEAKPIGECLWCGEVLDDGRRWCNAECRDAWELWRRR